MKAETPLKISVFSAALSRELAGGPRPVQSSGPEKPSSIPLLGSQECILIFKILQGNRTIRTNLPEDEEKPDLPGVILSFSEKKGRP